MTFQLHQPFSQFSNDIIFVDGLWGSGKSMLAPLISSMNGVEKAQIIEHVDYPLHLYAIKRIGFDEACILTRYSIDILSYNTQIGRGINLRWNDWSGLNLNSSGLRYIRRLFLREGDDALQQLFANQKALLLMPHYLFPSLDVLRSSLGKRLKYILVLRHPLFVFTHWHAYLQRFLSPREFTLSIEYRGCKVPWFSHEHLPNDLGDQGSITRTIALLTASYHGLLKSLRSECSDHRAQKPPDLFVVDFQQICYETASVLGLLTNFIGRPYTNSLQTILRTEKLPRSAQARGRGFLSYGFDPESKVSDSDFKAATLAEIQLGVSARLFDHFIGVIEDYEGFLSQLSFLS